MHGKTYAKLFWRNAMCDHNGKTKTYYTHIECNDCGAIKTDGDPSWGLAGSNWFRNLDEAEYYKKHGRYPEETRKL